MTALVTFDITVYIKPEGTQVGATLKALKNENWEYNEVSLEEDLEARDYVMSLGYLQAPVVISQWKVNGNVISEEHWSGYRPDRIKSLRSEFDSFASRVGLLWDKKFVNSLRLLVAE